MMRPKLVLFALLIAACNGEGPSDDEAGDTGTDDETGTGTETGTDTGTDDATDTGTDSETGMGDSVIVSGDAFAFGPYTKIADATVTVLEAPEYTTTTDANGQFELALPPGSQATLVFERDGYPITYTKTFTLPESGTVERVTFQVPDDATYAALASIVMIEPDPSTCQIASTVTRVGKSIYDEGAHGEAGATVTIEPALPAEHGPVYFNANVIPQPGLTETSDDGGVLYTNVPPGTYVLRASKPGVEFVDVTIECDEGVLVNPSPPYGLQAL
jgi:hypothetical protein